MSGPVPAAPAGPPGPDMPVLAVLPRLLDVLRAGRNAVLVAPPGAGKTTLVAPALLDQPWRGDGRILLTAPRRLAARAAAARIADLCHSPVGGLVGYSVRLDTRVSAQTRIEVVTDGLLVRRILADPELSGVAAILFDEVHERSIDGDTGLALALDVQGALRPDLRIVAMSATVDGARFARLLGQTDENAASADRAPVIESAGRMYPVETVHLPPSTPGLAIEQQALAAVRRALRETDGDILVFLPGVAELNRLARQTETAPLPDGVTLHLLHGGLEPRDQDRAIAPAVPGQRKVVAATAIAETSITLPGVRAVVDAGLARRPLFEPDTGLTRLTTVRASRASVDQRRGRAGRVAPGICYRLWPEPQTSALDPHDPPQIQAGDLAGLALTLAAWGVRDPAQLAWLDPPPPGAWSEAVRHLTELGALAPDGGITAHGRTIADFGLPPRLAHMVMEAEARHGLGLTAAYLAAVLGERGLGGTGIDLSRRIELLATDRSSRAAAARSQAQRWADSAGAPARQRLEPASAGTCLALAWPERVAVARDRRGGFLMAGGRAGELDPTDPLAGAQALVVGELQGSAAAARILGAAPLGPAELEAIAAARATTAREISFEPRTGLRARQVRRLGAIVLASDPVPVEAGPEATAALMAAVRRHGLSILTWSSAATSLRTRLAFLHAGDPAGWPAMDDAALVAALPEWLAPALEGVTDLARVDPGAALEAWLGWDRARDARHLAPAQFTTPLGIERPLTWDPDLGPVLEVRVQELYGLDRHPTAGRPPVPVLLELLSPAQRPIARTRDLPAFWRGGWGDVRRQMKAEYPKHPWPEQPWLAEATLRAKPRGT